MNTEFDEFKIWICRKWGMTLLTNLLGCLYQCEVPKEVGSPFYLGCLVEIERDALWGQVYHALNSNAMSEFVPSEFRDAVAERYMNVIGQNMLVRAEEERIWRAFESARIPVIPLKGTRFAERFFGNLAARGTSDVDLLIRREDFSHVAECLQGMGYSPPEAFNPRHYHCNVRRVVVGREMVVEIHWNIVKEYTSCLRIDEMWRRSSPLGASQFILELSVKDTFYAMCLHGANHQMKSLKHHLDLVQLLRKHSGEICFSELYQRAKRDKTLRRVRMVLRRTYSVFPGLWEVKPLDSFEYHARDPKHFSLAQYDSWVHRARVMKDWAWPSRDIARWFLSADEGVPGYRLYLEIYARRIRKAIHALNRGSGAREVDM